MVKPLNQVKLRFMPAHTESESASASTHCPICFQVRQSSSARHHLEVSLWAICGRIQGPERQEQSKNQDDSPGFQKSRQFRDLRSQVKYPGQGHTQGANSKCLVVPAVCTNQASQSHSAPPWKQCTSSKIKNKQPGRSKLCQCTGLSNPSSPDNPINCHKT